MKQIPGGWMHWNGEYSADLHGRILQAVSHRVSLSEGE